ncbi:MAG: hypothetical protein WKF73_05735 [Nocardioidaceae bacterium]
MTATANGDGDGEPVVVEPATAAAFAFAYQGTTGTVQVVEASDPRIAELEAYRKSVGGSPVTYVVADVDNTNGATPINMYAVDVVTAEGSQIFRARSVSHRIVKWDRGSTSARDIRLVRKFNVYLQPGAKGTAVLSTPKPVPSIARMWVYPAGGIEQVEAFVQQ